MKKPKLLHSKSYTDRHGKRREYFAPPGGAQIALPGVKFSTEYMTAYTAALESWQKGAKPEIGAARVKAGSLEAVIVSYYRSAKFLNLKPISQKTTRNVMERIRRDYGSGPVAKLERRHVEQMMAKLADKPAMANRFRKILKLLMKHAISLDLRKDDPTASVDKLKDRSAGYPTWTEDEIKQFYNAFEPGSREHLAMDLLLYTAQRRSDVVVMGRQHVRDGVLTIRQSKTGTEVSIPLHPDLRATLDRLPRENLNFLLTEQGAPFTPPGFTNWFNERVKKAGLTRKVGNFGLSPHGLRKAACVRLAEANCSPHEIMAITGHNDLAEIMRYTQAVNRRKLARKAIDAIPGRVEAD